MMDERAEALNMPLLRDRPGEADRAGPAGRAGPASHVPALPSPGPTPKACEGCARISIGRPYAAVSPLRVFFGLFFIYAPVLFMPLFIFGGWLAYTHLRLMGAQDVKRLRDFMPAWKTHRYSYKTQIIKEEGPRLAFWNRTRAFWLFNCSLYCPTSVAVMEWNTYLVKAVENWWCPFTHEKKENYATSALDRSYWHGTADEPKLHPDDRCNPIWNENAAAPER